MKIDEYAPIATPMNIANAKSFRVCPPNSSSDRMGSSTTSEVFTDRISSLVQREVDHARVSQRARRAPSDSVFSLILS